MRERLIAPRADHFDSASVLFADMVGFTNLTSRLKPAKLVDVLNSLFGEFDAIAERHEVEKIMTIGDGYMAGAEFRCDRATTPIGWPGSPLK